MLGVDAMDDEHRRIALAFSALFDAITARRSAQELKGRLSGLCFFFSNNCREEEEMMAHDKVPDADTHRVAHEKLLRHLESLHVSFDNMHPDWVMHQLDVIKQNIFLHIVEEDSWLASWHRDVGAPKLRIREWQGVRRNFPSSLQPIRSLH